MKFLAACLSILGLSSVSLGQSFDTQGPIKIMQYNVENLFDADHDRGKKDYEFLPKNHPQKAGCETVKNKTACYNMDWTPAKINMKLNQIRKIVAAQGSLPDIMVLEEVENEQVVTKLGSVLGYQYLVMTNSPDERGIDVAILYRTDRLRFAGQFQQRVNIGFATRDLIAANFQTVTGDVIGVFGNHWPSQLTPNSSGVRVAVAQTLAKFVEQVGQRFGDKYHVILAGDFNTIPQDNPHPFKEVILNKQWPRRFANARELYQKGGGGGIPPGTYYYSGGKVWNEFDIFFASQNLYDGQGLDLMIDSFRVIAPEWATQVISLAQSTFLPELTPSMAGVRIPKGYNHHATSEHEAGYSDHFGVTVRIKTGR